MDVNEELIDKLAVLSRLRFDAKEKEKIKADLQNIIGLIQKMDELNTDGVEPLLHITGNVNVMREDKIEGSISNEKALKNASVAEKPFFVVPKVIKKK